MSFHFVFIVTYVRDKNALYGINVMNASNSLSKLVIICLTQLYIVLETFTMSHDHLRLHPQAIPLINTHVTILRLLKQHRVLYY